MSSLKPLTGGGLDRHVTHLSGEHHDAGQAAREAEHALEEEQRVGEPNGGAHIVEEVADAVGELPAADPHDLLVEAERGARQRLLGCGRRGGRQSSAPEDADSWPPVAHETWLTAVGGPCTSHHTSINNQAVVHNDIILWKHYSKDIYII